ncbi:ankyrin repeat domain-containing protein [Candidatus Mesenet endosymbiont of Agriotes lineatus]|uniref:ankyrin repeat domain-containing protein n=1 Tax=Candidatus Mesenet endosymbiont of Agriotes lineatus TaxID=3077948 RepID=UPI0030CE3791
MYASEKQTDFYQPKLLSLISKSKEEFIRQYKKYDEIEAKEFYLQILTELKQAVLTGNINNLQNLSKLVDYISNIKDKVTLRTCYNNSNNPLRGTNLIILACKHNKIKMLDYLFGNDSKILDNLSLNIGKNTILPSDEDGECHNAFYYAVHSGNVKLLNTLINKWPGDYFTTHPEKLDETLSKAYEELKLKNVLLADEMEVFVENKLINLRFFSDNSRQIKNVKASLSNVKERIELVLENINLLKAEYSNVEEIDERFLFIAKFIAQNIHILKRQLKSTYYKLPWEEIEFCLIAFINSKISCQEINLIYSSTLTKNKILLHLENFAIKLEKAEISKADVNSKCPQLKREIVVATIISNCPLFKELYKDYEQVKNIYSLEKMANYIELALTADSRKEEGRLIIARVLQVTGEYLKNTSESPNISNDIMEVLLSSELQKSTGEVIKSFRNLLSHFYSLKKRIEIEESEDASYFSNVQNDLKKIKIEITLLREKNKAEAIRTFLKQITDSKDLKAAKKLADVLISIIPDLKEIKLEDTINTKEFIKLKSLIDELDEEIDDKTPCESKLFDQIKKIINLEETKLIDIQVNYASQIFNIASIGDYVNQVSSSKGYKTVKYINTINIESKIQFENFKDIPQLVYKIYDSAKLRTHSSKFGKINHLINSICYTIRLEIGGIKGIEVLKERITADKDGVSSIVTEQKIQGIKAQDCLNKRLGTLKSILSANELLNDSNLIEKFSHYKKNKELQLIVEMLVLDITEVLQHLGYLGNNLLFLDKYSPLLIGRCLRNHLAHGNALINVLQFDTSIIIISNALKLIKEEKNLATRKIGRSILDNLSYLRDHYIYNLNLVTNQQEMFKAARKGDLDKIKDCISKGADVKARDINQWTLLHFTAAGGSLEATKFFLDYDLDVNAKDIENQKPLHIAAAYGRKSIVEFFIREKGLCVNDLGNNGKTPLHIATKNGHKDVVEILLKYRSDIEAKDISNLTPLHYAAQNGHKDIIILLLLNKKNTVNSTGGDDWTPLHFASYNGHLEVVKILLKKKANINAKTNEGDTPLSCAAQQDYVEVVKTLLAHGANVNNQSVDGLTPLYSAAWRGNLEVVIALLIKKAKVNILGNNWIPLHAATRQGYFDIVKILLINGGKVDYLGNNNVTALQLAAEYGHLDVAQLLIDNKANVSKVNKNGYTPLHFAAKGGYDKIVKVLLAEGANARAQTINNTATPLHFAARYGHLEVAKTLIQNCVDINAKTANGSTSLCYAAEYGYDEVVKTLLKKGAKVDDPNNNKWTPLHYAAHDGRLDVVNTLLDNGANPKAKTGKGNTPLHLAAENDHLEIVKVLFKKTGVNTKSNSSTPLNRAAEGGHLEIVEFLLANGANVNAKDNDNWTPLRVAVQNGHLGIVKVLLKNKANASAVDNEDCTPLRLAAQEGHVMIVEALLTGGANVNVLDHTNWTPLHFAAARGHECIVETLLNNGACVNAKAKNDITPLYLAVKNGHVKVAKVLLKRGARIDIFREDIQGTLLHLAVANDCKEIAEILLQNDSTIVNTKAENGWAPLHVAAAGNKSEVIEVLLKNKANIDVRDNENCTPLFLAVRLGHVKVVEALLTGGANVNVLENILGKDKIPFAITSLHLAIRKGHKEMVEVILKNGANIDIKADDGCTPLHLAAREGHQDIVEDLLKRGAKVNTADNNSQTPLQLTAAKGYEGIIKVLLNHRAKIDARAKDGATALHRAAFYGHENIVEILLNEGAKIDNPDEEMWTPLHHAVQQGQEKAAKVLLLKGANVNFTDKGGRTPLHWSAQKGYEKVIEILLQNKANVDGIDDHIGMTPLHLASANGHLKAVLALLGAKDININAIDSSYRTPLHYAVFGRYKEVIKTLLDKGAYFDDESYDKSTPLQTVSEKGYSEIEALLKLIEKLFNAIRNNNYSEVQSCIERGVLINSRSIHFGTPLLYASWKGYINIANILLKSGANVNIANDNSLTPLHYAAKFNHFEVVYSLLKHGAMFDVASSKGSKMPLDFAKDAKNSDIACLLQLISRLFEGAKSGNYEIVKELETIRDKNLNEFLAITNARNDQGKSLVQVAIINEHKDLASELLKMLKKPDQNLQDINVESRVRDLKL